jgi:hypothetical protein
MHFEQDVIPPHPRRVSESSEIMKERPSKVGIEQNLQEDFMVLEFKY